MSKPRVAVIGSCVTRDNFNSNFSSVYKDRVNLVAEAYQCSLPSLARHEPIGLQNAGLSGKYGKVLADEYSGESLDKIADSRPDYVIMDGYADVQFGVTKKDGLYVTRNHMAFISQEDSNDFYGDAQSDTFERGRFGEAAWYEDLAVNSLYKIIDRIRDRNNRATFIVNQARFALNYQSKLGQVIPYPNADRLATKNDRWEAIDGLMTGLGAVALSFNDDVFMGDEYHRWGLNPVHYQQRFYDEFWDQLDSVIT